MSGEDWADFPLPSIYTSDKVLLTPQNVDYEAALVTGIHWAGLGFGKGLSQLLDVAGYWQIMIQ